MKPVALFLAGAAFALGIMWGGFEVLKIVGLVVIGAGGGAFWMLSRMNPWR